MDDVLFSGKAYHVPEIKNFQNAYKKEFVYKKEHVSYHFALPSDSYFHGSHLCGVESCETYLGSPSNHRDQFIVMVIITSLPGFASEYFY